jgi:hypothetical protein
VAAKDKRQRRQQSNRCDQADRERQRALAQVDDAGLIPDAAGDDHRRCDEGDDEGERANAPIARDQRSRGSQGGGDDPDQLECRGAQLGSSQSSSAC